MHLSAVILAGGQSRRMGQDKAWVQYQGRPLVSATVERVKSIGIDELFISARPDQDYSALNCRVLFDAEMSFGPMTGIEKALARMTSDFLLVLPVDLPRMTPVCLAKMMRCCDRLTGAVAELHGEIEPLVAIYPRRCHQYALKHIAHADYAVRSFASACLHDHAVRVFRVPNSQSVCFANCNTPQDLASLDDLPGLSRVKPSMSLQAPRAALASPSGLSKTKARKWENPG